MTTSTSASPPADSGTHIDGIPVEALDAEGNYIEPDTGAPPEPAVPTASTDTAALEAAWDDIRGHHDDLPRVYFTTGSGMEGRQGQARWGHWAAKRWCQTDDPSEAIGEVLIAGERLEFGAEGVMETLLHESGHALAFVREIEDTSRQGRYHNREYKKLAEEVGLDVEKGKHGWNTTSLPAATLAKYASTIQALTVALAGYRVAPAKEEKEKKKKSRATLTCSCERRIQVAFSVAALGKVEGEMGFSIKCGMCDEPFEDLLGDVEDYLADLDEAGMGADTNAA
jgi:hypothetical protein